MLNQKIIKQRLLQSQTYDWLIELLKRKENLNEENENIIRKIPIIKIQEEFLEYKKEKNEKMV